MGQAEGGGCSSLPPLGWGKSFRRKQPAGTLSSVMTFWSKDCTSSRYESAKTTCQTSPPQTGQGQPHQACQKKQVKPWPGPTGGWKHKMPPWTCCRTRLGGQTRCSSKRTGGGNAKTGGSCKHTISGGHLAEAKELNKERNTSQLPRLLC